MSIVTLSSKDRVGIEVAEVPEDLSVYCNLSYDSLEFIEPDVGIHIWAKNLIEDPNPRKGEDRDRWESWISLQKYDRLLSLLDEFSTESYDDVNDNDIAYTSCTSRGAICFVCGEDLMYREDDVLSITGSLGPIYCHEDCVDDFYEIVKSIENEASTIVSQVV